jgi:hypothetical protein
MVQACTWSKGKLKHAYIVECTDVIKNNQGEVAEVHCKYIPESRVAVIQAVSP